MRVPFEKIDGVNIMTDDLKLKTKVHLFGEMGNNYARITS